MRARRLTRVLFPARNALSLFRPAPSMLCRTNSTAASPTLPHLIFGDNHTDRIEQDTLTELAPSLKALGYKQVLLEFGESEGWDEIDIYLAGEDLYYQGLVKLFSGRGLDITNSKHVADFLKNYPKEQFKIIAENEQNGELTGLDVLHLRGEVKRNTRRMDATIQFRGDTEALIKFVKTYKALGFTCRSIDLADDVTAGNSNAEIQASMERRSIAMANSICAADGTAQPAIVIIGLGHIAGIQKVLIEKFGADAAKSKFSFINLFTKDRPETTLEKEIHTGKIHFPLGLHQIDDKRAGKYSSLFINAPLEDKIKQILSSMNHSITNEKENVAQRMT